MFEGRISGPQLVLLCVACVACQGSIGDAADPTNPLGVPPIESALGDSEATDSPRLWRLNNVQYRRALDSLLGEDAERGMLQEVSGHGFPNTADQNPIGESRVIEYQNIAQTRTAAAMADPSRWPSLWPCARDAGAAEADFHDSSCVARFIDEFGARAFRRDLLEEERVAYMSFFDETRAAVDGPAAVQLVIETMIQSPSFLYRTELGSLSEAPPVPDELVHLTPAEQASLLSFSLWGTSPDDALLEEFEAETVDLRAIALAMMEDPRFADGFGDFVDGLLELDTLESASPAVGYEGDWVALTQSMRQEPRAFVDYLLFSGEVDADFAELWTADYNFADARLAPLYGGAVEGDGFERLTTTGRPGILGQLGVLASHSLPNGTSPPRRGKLVATRVFCQSIPAPPDNIEVDSDAEDTRTTREFFEVATGEGTCGGACHVFLNPPGFAFENFDAIGVWRDTENGVTVDASADLNSFGLGSVTSAAELGEAISDSERARACLVREYFRFTLGRIDRPENSPVIEALQEQFAASDGDLRTLLLESLTHPALHARRMRE